MATKKFDPNERTIEIGAERDGVKLTLLLSPIELAEALRSSGKEERETVIYELFCDGKDAWEFAKKEVRESGQWEEWER